MAITITYNNPYPPNLPNKVSIYDYNSTVSAGWGRICCAGNVINATRGTPIFGKVYPGNYTSSVPNSPIGQSPQLLGNVGATNTPFAGCLDGAAGNSAGNQVNTVVVWAQDAGGWFPQSMLFYGFYCNQTDCATCN